MSRGAQELIPAPAPTAPPGRAVLVSFLYLATWAFVLYGVGVATPYLRADLGLSDFQAGLHGSALAVGVLVAGFSADSIGHRIGQARLRDVSAAILIAAIALVALAPALPASLAGVFFIGLGGGMLGTDVNFRLGSYGGIETRRLMSQANALGMVSAVAAPLTIGLAASVLHAWRVALLMPIVSFAILSLVRPRAPQTLSSVRRPRSRLPRAYWFIWLLIVFGVSIEFSLVFWGSTIVGKRTGITSAEATLLASLFIVGMFVGRLAAGSRRGASRPPRELLVGGLLVAMAGSGLTWVSTVPILSGVGLLVAGLGTACLYPIGLAAAMNAAPEAPLEAATRVTLASGVAVLLAPSVLGLAADLVGVVAAWPITLALAVGGLLVLAVTPRATQTT